MSYKPMEITQNMCVCVYTSYVLFNLDSICKNVDVYILYHISQNGISARSRILLQNAIVQHLQYHTEPTESLSCIEHIYSLYTRYPNC